MTDIEKLEQALQAQEALRPVLGDAVVEVTIEALRQKLEALRATLVAPPAPQEQRKLVTVLFADVFGFTAMSETMDAEDVGATINALWQRLDAVIAAYGGTIDKHIGDAIMALWGVRVAQEDDPEQAIQAALAMQKELGVWRAERQATPAANLQIRIGLNTGPVLLSAIGSTAEFTALGDTVNLASRLQHEAPVGGILISHDTFRHVRGVFTIRALPPLTLKGKAEPVQAYLVEGAKRRSFRLGSRGVEGIETRTIGRATEIAQLQAAVRAVLATRTLRMVTLVGEAGVGKSRLMYELDNWVDLLPDTVWYFRARLTQATAHLPYALWRDLFNFRFEILESDPPDEACQKFERGIAEFMRAMPDEALETAHFIGYLLGLNFSDSPFVRGIRDDARQIRDRAYHGVVRLLAMAMTRLPVFMYLEDVHWADESSLDLLTHVLQACHTQPMFALCLTRPDLYERWPEWGVFAAGAPAPAERLDLAPLSKDDSRSLVEEILRKVDGLPETLRELIVNSAEGNPFYVEELIKMFIDERVIVIGEERWRVEPGRLVDVRVPPTLTGVIQARLDSLTPFEREVIQRAAVIGRVFWEGAVEALQRDTPTLDVPPALDALSRKELIFRRSKSAFAGTREFIFKHVLVQEVTYESTLKRQRRAYHAQAAVWLSEQSQSEGRSAERSYYAGLIAEHYERAEIPLEAAHWYGRAGDQARQAYAPSGASNYYQRALMLGAHATPAQRLEWHEGLGGVLQAQARYAEATEAYQAMCDLAQAGEEEPLAQARAYTGLANVQQSWGASREALDNAVRAETLARQANAPVEVAHAVYLRGWILYRLGDAAQALALGEQALALSTALPDARVMAHSYRLLGAAHYVLGQHTAAMEAQQQALALYRQMGDRSGERAMLNNLGDGARLRGDYEVAVNYLEQALIISREIGHRDGEITTLSNLGAARNGLGAHATAEADLRTALSLVGESGSFVVAFAYIHLARALLGQDQSEGALTVAQQALQFSQVAESLEDIGEAWLTLGEVLARTQTTVVVGDTPYTARECFQHSLQTYATMNAEAERAKALRAWAKYELEHAEAETGARLWHEAQAIFRKLDMQLELARMEAGPVLAQGK